MFFWDRLRNELSYQNITHKELAAKLNMPKNTLETKFMRENTPDAEFLYQCSKVLNLSMDYLYTGQEKNIEFSSKDIELLNLCNNLKPEHRQIISALLTTLTAIEKKQ